MESKKLPNGQENVSGFTTYSTILVDIITCPLNIALSCICILLSYIIVKLRRNKKPKKILQSLSWRDFTLDELSDYDGTNAEGRILIAVNGFIFDVTNDREGLYSPTGPYAAYAGRDASRALARFSVDTASPQDYDDLADLTKIELDNLKEWERQFRAKFTCIGKLLSPGETHRVYEGDVQNKVS